MLHQFNVLLSFFPFLILVHLLLPQTSLAQCGQQCPPHQPMFPPPQQPLCPPQLPSPQPLCPPQLPQLPPPQLPCQPPLPLPPPPCRPPIVPYQQQQQQHHYPYQTQQQQVPYQTQPQNPWGRPLYPTSPYQGLGQQQQRPLGYGWNNNGYGGMGVGGMNGYGGSGGTYGYGYGGGGGGYGRPQILPPSYYIGNPNFNPIPANERLANTGDNGIDEEKHETVKDPFEKEEDKDNRGEAHRHSGGDEDNAAEHGGKEHPKGILLRDPSSSSQYALPGLVRPAVQLPGYALQPPQQPMPMMPPPPQWPPCQTIPQQPPPMLPCPAPMQPPSLPCPSHCPPPPMLPLPPPLLPPPPAPMPLPPIQNCCLRCGRPSCKALMATSAKARGAKTSSNGTKLARLLAIGGHQQQQQLEEDQCNDRVLAKIFKEVEHLGMAEAKEAILSRAEQEQKQQQSLIHVFCAPAALEYAARTEQFCAGQVADGLCFAFRTIKG